MHVVRLFIKHMIHFVDKIKLLIILKYTLYYSITARRGSIPIRSTTNSHLTLVQITICPNQIHQKNCQQPITTIF